ncbi:hypothetical protein GGS20DRAFT_542516 [Poronia punctata]|nr:hypothetical protein GGS20DRAFT_542516 [Poronia punctata]
MSLGSHYVEPNQSRRYYRPNKRTDSPPTTDSQVTIVHDLRPEPEFREPQQQSSGHPTTSSQMTGIHFAPSPPEAPTFASVPSEEEVYGPERYSGYRYHVPSYASSTPRPSPAVHFNQTPFPIGTQADPLVHRDFKDELTRAAGAVTPGVSDVPYIRYALEAMSQRRAEDTDSEDVYMSRHQIIPQFSVNVSRSPPARESLTAAVDRDEPVIPEHWPVPPSTPPTASSSAGSTTPSPPIISMPAREERRAIVDRGEQPEEPNPYLRRLDDITRYYNHAIALHERGPPTAEPNHNPPRNVDVWQAHPDNFTPEDLEAMGFKTPPPPPLTHKPWILRMPSLLLFATACILMITALVFSAVYSIGQHGFTPYAGSIYGGQYFVFRVLPQLVGVFMLVYAQCIAAAVSRVFPFSAMASDDRRERRDAVFLPLYPKTFLWPQLFGPWNVWVPTLVIWLTNFSVPLLSCLYTVDLVEDVWTWSTVQGVAWTLVAVYVSLLASTAVLLAYWQRRRTGMIESWDVRSTADIIFLVAQSNSLPQYRGLETAATRKKMKDTLDGTAERLGYWTTPEAPENSIFWGFGVPTTEEDLEAEKWDRRDWAAQRSKSRPVTLEDVENQKEPWSVRYRYLPWCFRDSQIIFFVVAGTVLLVAMVTVSFLHSTDIRNGFLPGLSAAPVRGTFSPADFLYAFIPSLIGLLLFLAFQSLDLTLRVLAPWGELAREEGSPAETSLLLDYAACLPWQSTYKAVKYRHWRVAFITFLSPLFALLPVLGGGLFMALTAPSGVVLMYSNVSIFGLILALLFLYLAALASLVPQRKSFRLPHAVTCLAEIMSFCCNEQLRTDEAFNQARSVKRAWFKEALDCGKDRDRQGRWTFGAGKNNEERLGIKRHSKFTVSPSKLKQYEKPISAPVLRHSGSPYGH